jgi:anionic cell wall polymer biosynthesis LytR-Cps2A-Psr (LCP) family protein
MDGETALKFVRSRHSDTHGGDFARAQRQLAVLLALKNKVISVGALDDLSAFISKFRNVLKTDISVQVIEDVLGDMPNIAQFEIKSIHLTDENVLTESRSSSGQFILIPREGIGKWGKVQEFIRGG